MIEDKVPASGSYQVYIGVRNGLPEKEPARSQGLIRRVDWKQEAARIGGASEYLEIPPGPSPPPLFLRGTRSFARGAGEPSQLAFRTLGPISDPALRNFRIGDTLTYDAPAPAQIRILRDGEVVDSAEANGTYHLRDTLKPGQYMLSVKTGAQEQWADFRIINHNP
jgi:hypothetical protein